MDGARNRPIGSRRAAGALAAAARRRGRSRPRPCSQLGLLLASNNTPWLFRSGGMPTWAVHDDDGLPMARPVTEERLRHMLAKLADWRYVWRATGDLVPAHPPTPLIKSLLATPDPGLPVLAGIVTTPVFGRNGALLTEPGYHPDARLLYQPTPGFAVPQFESVRRRRRSRPREAHRRRHAGRVPFTGHAERAHAVALMLLGFLRAMIDAPTLHLIEKPTPGTGATLMVDAIATVLTGVSASVMTEGRDDEEWRKRLTAKLRQILDRAYRHLRHLLDSGAGGSAHRALLGGPHSRCVR